MGAAIFGAIVIAVSGHRTWRQIGSTALLLIPCTVAGYLLVFRTRLGTTLFPTLIEELHRSGSVCGLIRTRRWRAIGIVRR